MSALPFLSWIFSIVFRHACVLASLVEVGATTSACEDKITDQAAALYVFFWWALVYECFSFMVFCLFWAILPCITLYLLSVAIRPRDNAHSPNQDQLSEPLTEFCKEQFHKHVRSGDHLYDFIIGFTGLNTIIKKNDLARLLVSSSKEQTLSKKDVMLWTTDDVFNWAQSIGMGKYAHKFIEDKISGNLLLTHVDPDLLHKGFGMSVEEATLTWDKLNELRKPTTVGSWSVNEVCDWLCRIGMSQYMEDFRRLLINGQMLVNHDEKLVQVLTAIPTFHRHQLIAEMKVLRNEGAPMTVGENYGRHPLNQFGRALAIQPASYEELKSRAGLRDVEALTPIVTEDPEKTTGV
jgi:hypothetical protein